MTLLSAIINPALYLRHWSNTRKYLRHLHRLPNYFEPRLYTEKIQWRKLCDRNPLFPILSDKLKVREFVRERAPSLRLPEVYWSGTNPKEIPYDQLPHRFVIKPNHRSGDVYFVRSSEDRNREKIEGVCWAWLKKPYGLGKREWAYRDLAGSIIIEEMLATSDQTSMSRDIRFHVFDGRVEVIVVDFGEFQGTERHVIGVDNLYDRDWHLLPYRRQRDEMLPQPEIPKPATLVDMTAAAEALGTGIDYVRADFYLIDDACYFGEITLYPGSGYARYIGPAGQAQTFDEYLGSKWTLPRLSHSTQLWRALRFEKWRRA
jgi:hypothetical protein